MLAKKTLLIIPLIVTGSICARVAKTSAPKKPAAQPKTSAAVQTRQQTTQPVQPIAQQSSTTEPLLYSEILSALKQKNPDSSDISSLRNLQAEVQRQIDMIMQKTTTATNQASSGKSPNISQRFQMGGTAYELMQKHHIPLTATTQQIAQARKFDTDIFPAEIAAQQVAKINLVVKEFLNAYPNLTKQDCIGLLVAQATQRADVQKLQQQTTSQEYEEIIDFIKKAIGDAWDSVKS